MTGLIVDLFAGGGGTSTGFQMALGRPPNIAVNHCPAAIAMHRANHPQTRHYVADVFEVDPVEACGGRPVAVLWASPDCTHHSRARGGRPRETGRRALADVVIDWAKKVRPQAILLENVPEFETWGPLLPNGKPDPAHAGDEFRRWKGELKALGYRIEHRILCAADYGAPTTRRRLFLQARCDGAPIVWPKPSHGPGCLQPYRTAAEIIDWSVPARSIFERKKPLADATLKRVATGLKRFVLDAENPMAFIVSPNHGTTTPSYQNVFRGQGLDTPLGTVCTSNDRALVIPFISEYYGTGGARSVADPLSTVTTHHRHGLILPYLAKHYTGVTGHRLDQPIGAITTVDHHSLVEATTEGNHADDVTELLARFGFENTPIWVGGDRYRIADLRMRMLVARELFLAQGFPKEYRLDITLDGRRLTGTELIRLAGNSVCPDAAAAVIDCAIPQLARAA